MNINYFKVPFIYNLFKGNVTKFRENNLILGSFPQFMKILLLTCALKTSLIASTFSLDVKYSGDDSSSTLTADAQSIDQTPRTLTVTSMSITHKIGLKRKKHTFDEMLPTSIFGRRAILRMRWEHLTDADFMLTISTNHDSSIRCTYTDGSFPYEFIVGFDPEAKDKRIVINHIADRYSGSFITGAGLSLLPLLKLTNNDTGQFALLELDLTKVRGLKKRKKVKRHCTIFSTVTRKVAL